MDLDDCEEAPTRANKDGKNPYTEPAREWATDAIDVLRAFDAMVRGVESPTRTCPICLVHGDHERDCKLRVLLRHADHAERPEEGRTRELAVQTVARLIYWWGIGGRELAAAIRQARADFERAQDERASHGRPNYRHQAEEAAGATSTGVDELVDAIGAGNLEDAGVHLHTIAKLTHEATAAAAAEARTEPTDLEVVRDVAERAAEATQRLAGAVDRFVAFAVEKYDRIAGQVVAQLDVGGGHLQ